MHSLSTTPAKGADITGLPRLLHGQESELFGDQAYWSEFHGQCAEVSGIRYRTNRRGPSTKPLTEHQKFVNRIRSSSRARGEHAFHVVKRLWGSARSAAADWPRTLRGCSRPLRWPISTCSDDD